MLVTAEQFTSMLQGKLKIVILLTTMLQEDIYLVIKGELFISNLVLKAM